MHNRRKTHIFYRKTKYGDQESNKLNTAKRLSSKLLECHGNARIQCGKAHTNIAFGEVSNMKFVLHTTKIRSVREFLLSY